MSPRVAFPLRERRGPSGLAWLVALALLAAPGGTCARPARPASAAEPASAAASTAPRLVEDGLYRN
jgi:hypothetical protein